MIPVNQRQLHYPPGQRGDCYSACIASILKLSIEDVPWFTKDTNPNWLDDAYKFVMQYGYLLI